MTDEELLASVRTAQSTHRRTLTLVRVVVKDEHDWTIVDEHPTVLPGLLSIKMTVKDKTLQPKFDTVIEARQKPIALRQPSGKSPAEYFAALESGLAKGDFGFSARTRGVVDPQSIIEVDASPLRVSHWEDIQTITVTISPGPHYQREFEMATELLNGGDREAAIDLLQELVAQAPNFAPAYYELGRAHFELSDHLRAERSFSSALRQGLPFGAIARAHVYLAAIALIHGAPPRARWYIEQIDPGALRSEGAWASRFLRDQFVKRKQHESSARELLTILADRNPKKPQKRQPKATPKATKSEPS
jgi:tetratricopeptide (TPR) repeat protein